MSSIAKPNTFSSNTPISSSQVNANFDTIYNDYNGNVSEANLADDAVTTDKIADDAVTAAKIINGSISNAKLNTTAGEVGGAWTAWTPTWTNLTVGSGTVVARYTQIGKTIHFRLIFVYGSGSAVGTNPTFTLPVTHITYTSPGSFLQIGYGEAQNLSTSSYNLGLRLNSTTVCQLYALNSSTAIVEPTAINSTLPFTWGTGDGFTIQGTYEAA